VALRGAELEHRLKAVAAAAGVTHNRTIIVDRCHGQSAVIYLLNKTETEPYGGFKQEAQLSLTNHAMLVFKVTEVWQDFLSEYVDKKFTYICYRRLIRHE